LGDEFLARQSFNDRSDDFAGILFLLEHLAGLSSEYAPAKNYYFQFAFLYNFSRRNSFHGELENIIDNRISLNYEMPFLSFRNEHQRLRNPLNKVNLNNSIKGIPRLRLGMTQKIAFRNLKEYRMWNLEFRILINTKLNKTKPI